MQHRLDYQVSCMDISSVTDKNEFHKTDKRVGSKTVGVIEIQVKLAEWCELMLNLVVECS